MLEFFIKMGMKTDVVIIIPARYASSWFEGKPLAPLVGATGVAKSLIERSWNTAMQVVSISDVYVVTDDDRIADAARAFGAEVVMTSSDCQNGTERVAEAVKIVGQGSRYRRKFTRRRAADPALFF